MKASNKALKELTYKIEGCLKCYKEFKKYSEEDRIRFREWYNQGPWFFPPYKKVMGFLGDGKVVFVCQRPSTGTFPDKKVKLFYKLIEKYGFKDAHITDLVKCRRKAKEPMDKMIQNCLPFLEQEIEILKPKLIVAVGNKVKRILEKKFANREIEIEYITHYAYRGKDRNKRLRKDFRRLREKYYITLE
jgi:uracil-DNA glycosylase family 4